MCQELMNETEDPGVGEALDEKLNDLGNKLVLINIWDLPTTVKWEIDS